MAEEDTNRSTQREAHKEKQILFEYGMIGEHESCLI